MATTQSAILVDGVDATVKALQAQVTGDSVKRFQVLTDGSMSWGSGSATADVTLYRSAADVLKTDDSFHVGVNLRVNTASLGGGVGVIGLDADHAHRLIPPRSPGPGRGFRMSRPRRIFLRTPARSPRGTWPDQGLGRYRTGGRRV